MEYKVFSRVIFLPYYKFSQWKWKHCMTVGGWFLMRYLEWRSEKLDHSRGQVVGTNLSAVCGMDDFCKILCSVT